MCGKLNWWRKKYYREENIPYISEEASL